MVKHDSWVRSVLLVTEDFDRSQLGKLHALKYEKK